jgi:integrase
VPCSITASNVRGPALKLLTDLRAKRSNESDFLFPGTNLSKPFDFKKAWVKAIAESGIEDFRFHDLRHTAASELAMNYATIPEIAAMLGHKTFDMARRPSEIAV